MVETVDGVGDIFCHEFTKSLLNFSSPMSLFFFFSNFFFFFFRVSSHSIIVAFCCLFDLRVHDDNQFWCCVGAGSLANYLGGRVTTKLMNPPTAACRGSWIRAKGIAGRALRLTGKERSSRRWRRRFRYRRNLRKNLGGGGGRGRRWVNQQANPRYFLQIFFIISAPKTIIVILLGNKPTSQQPK